MVDFAGGNEYSIYSVLSEGMKIALRGRMKII